MHVKEGGSLTSFFPSYHSSHPIVMFFHLAFRTASLIQYLLASVFTDNFVFILVIQVLLITFDFWTVKNVSGRILVGLRWWNEVKEDGTSTWVYESRQVSVLSYSREENGGLGKDLYAYHTSFHFKIQLIHNEFSLPYPFILVHMLPRASC